MHKRAYRFTVLFSAAALIGCGDDATPVDDTGSTGTDPATSSIVDTTTDDTPTTTTSDDTTTDVSTTSTTSDDTTTSTTDVPTTDTTDPTTGSTDTTDATDTTDTTDTTAADPICGDGVVDPGETCDDGNQVDTDDCTNACQTAACGDGVIQDGVEACDDGNLVDTDACTGLCQDAACGDGLIQEGVEGCDDGNVIDGDGCSATCTSESCGDGIVQGMEACDDGNADDTDDCTSLCAAATCGDGFVWANNEACDDGNVEDTDDCLGTCEAASCGDGFVWANNEACDDGNDDDHDDCLGTCEAASCGDGFVNDGVESCDEGDPDNGGGCSSSCAVELYSRCVGEGPGTCNPIRILYAPADNDTAAYRTAIAAVTGGVADYFDARNATPTLANLQSAYDCVFTHPNFVYNNSATMGTLLRDFVDGGANVVLGIATDYNPATGLNGTPIMDIGYSPIATSGSVVGGVVNYSGNGVTVIHTGVNAYGLNLMDNGVVLQGGGVADGTYTNGSISAAYRPDFKVVYLNGTGDQSFGPTGQWGLLTANACAAGYVFQP